MKTGNITFDEVLNDLRIVLLNEAAKIRLIAGSQVAEAFLNGNTDVGNVSDLGEITLKIKEFPIYSLVSKAWTYAYENPMWNADRVLEEASYWAYLIDAYFPKGRLSEPAQAFEFELNGQTGNLSGALESLLVRAHARWKLADGWSISDEEIALIANINLRTVKNALSSKGTDYLPAERKIMDNGMVFFEVSSSDALDWLEGRRGYIPIFGAGGHKRYGAAYLKHVSTAAELSAVLFEEGSELFNDNSCPNLELLANWKASRFLYDLPLVQWVAERIRIDIPLLAGKVTEVSLRGEAK